MLTFDEILKRLSPFATSAWTKRFLEIRNRGPKMWLLVLRDFDIQTPEIEYAVNDVIREIEVLEPKKSLVRAEMEKLEGEGKLKLDTPEEEAYWESRLEEERKKFQLWKKDENETYMKQKKMDLEFLKKKRESENNPVPIAHEQQDPKKNTAINPEDVNIARKSDHAHQATETELLPDTVPVSEAEKAQKAFVPKPPPDKEPPVIMPKIKSIAVEGEEIYNTANKEESAKKVYEIEGMPQDAALRLQTIGVTTEKSFKEMDRTQARKILGMPLFKRFEGIFTSQE